MFPSPCGDYGSYHGADSDYAIEKNCFRPLAGIMVLIRELDDSRDEIAEYVSVPLRGLWFLSKTASNMNTSAKATVSVPLRGLWFLSR